jgi:hypothetical protein
LQQRRISSQSPRKCAAAHDPRHMIMPLWSLARKNGRRLSRRAHTTRGFRPGRTHHGDEQRVIRWSSKGSYFLRNGTPMLGRQVLRGWKVGSFPVVWEVFLAHTTGSFNREIFQVLTALKANSFDF